ncbi:hypothetical protein HPP92_000691 [Vanilla planifolia]|uniref:Uncharacterized protein n=1 Tax=Vanilla planifolia TaxID=51239 RepID=A0A835VHA3_VANPL|nr:hypothetical protein HPP92_000766 [Vanilla planifolia]KAG0500619.1 hypothetical protein HPP92_000691 [Vanilla planifolia]
MAIAPSFAPRFLRIRSSCCLLQSTRIFSFQSWDSIFSIEANRYLYDGKSSDRKGYCRTNLRGPAVVFIASRCYAQDRKPYNLFGSGIPGDQEFRKAWAEDVDDDDCLWTASDEDEDDIQDNSKLKKEMKKLKMQAKENSELIDADDSDELRSLISESDEEINLWSGTEDDDDDDIPTEPHQMA